MKPCCNVVNCHKENKQKVLLGLEDNILLLGEFLATRINLKAKSFSFLSHFRNLRMVYNYL